MYWGKRYLLHWNIKSRLWIKSFGHTRHFHADFITYNPSFICKIEFLFCCCNENRISIKIPLLFALYSSLLSFVIKRGIKYKVCRYNANHLKKIDLLLLYSKTSFYNVVKIFTNKETLNAKMLSELCILLHLNCSENNVSFDKMIMKYEIYDENSRNDLTSGQFPCDEK